MGYSCQLCTQATFLPFKALSSVYLIHCALHNSTRKLVFSTREQRLVLLVLFSVLCSFNRSRGWCSRSCRIFLGWRPLLLRFSYNWKESSSSARPRNHSSSSALREKRWTKLRLEHCCTSLSVDMILRQDTKVISKRLKISLIFFDAIICRDRTGVLWRRKPNLWANSLCV